MVTDTKMKETFIKFGSKAASLEERVTQTEFSQMKYLNYQNIYESEIISDVSSGKTCMYVPSDFPNESSNDSGCKITICNEL